MLRRKVHVNKKRDELNLKFRKMHWLIGRNSELTIDNKLLFVLIVQTNTKGRLDVGRIAYSYGFVRKQPI
jgi:hypothetical protein